jgi:hypothetical protein
MRLHGQAVCRGHGGQSAQNGGKVQNLAESDA